jgi:hypothetical protein
VTHVRRKQQPELLPGQRIAVEAATLGIRDEDLRHFGYRLRARIANITASVLNRVSARDHINTAMCYGLVVLNQREVCAAIV